MPRKPRRKQWHGLPRRGYVYVIAQFSDLHMSEINIVTIFCKENIILGSFQKSCVRCVRALRWPARAKLSGFAPPAVGGALPLLSPGWVFGAALTIILLSFILALAEGWKNAATTTGWPSVDRFRAETPRTNNRKPSVPINVFLTSLQEGEFDKLMALISRVESLPR